jgi:hypothetical protein
LQKSLNSQLKFSPPDNL